MDEFDQEMADFLRGKHLADQGLPPEGKSMPQIVGSESMNMCTLVQNILTRAGGLLSEGNMPHAAITMQMALTTSNVAICKAIQEFSQIYVALITGTVKVVHLNDQEEVKHVNPDLC